MLDYKPNMGPKELAKFEEDLKNEYIIYKNETEKDLQFRLNGVSATRGSSGKQFVGYQTLEQFYRGDQWDHDEPPGASQRTDNYCASIVDNFSSLLFDAPVEINCPSQDETDDLLELMAEFKEKMLKKIYDDNDADEIVFPELSKCGSEFGDAFIKGPMLEKNGSTNKKDWEIVFFNVENPANIRPLFEDENYRKLYGFIDTTSISPIKAMRLYGKQLRHRGIKIEDIIKKNKGRLRIGQRSNPNISSQTTYQSMIHRHEYWTKEIMAIFIEDELVDWYWHDWGFVPLEYIKNIYVPNHPYGKSDIEDAIDPQLFHTVVNNDLANALKFLSTITLKGKNLDGMEVLVHGLSKIFNIPEDGELDPVQRGGDPYATGNFVDGRRRAILDVSGVSEALMSTIQNQNPSGRAMSMALQSVIRKLNPRIKRYQKALRSLNKNIFKLLERYYPETKDIIAEDYH
ncbi:MAG TPA: phage portal protein, partial [Desulfobacterales bacterium]|nr:phage portal protein [Desulfobacterales bacterium]